jgi:Cof subfamily protein (haloacid dehalogenase superfamily)
MSGAQIRLVLSDVDGTLVTGDKALTARAIAAVRRLHDAGIAFAVTSGRPPRGMSMLIEPLELRTPIAGFNGGTFARPDLSVIESHTVPADVAADTLEILARHKLDAWIYTPGQWLVRDINAAHVAREEWTVKFPPQAVSGFTDEHLRNVVKIVGVCDDFNAVAEAEQNAQHELGERASATRSQPYYLDVTNPAANKGGVADRLVTMLGLDRSQIVTIGDGPNDVLMFRRSGMSIAMGNADDSVKQSATHVTQSNEDEGFAVAIDQFVLRQAAA